MKFKGIPAKERKHILRCVEKLRRGLLSFEYLFRRTVTKLVDAKEDWYYLIDLDYLIDCDYLIDSGYLIDSRLN